MIYFFGDPAVKVFALQTNQELTKEDEEKLYWLFGNQSKIGAETLNHNYVGPRATMITPWSTNATEITQNMGISGIVRIEEYLAVNEDYTGYDPMLSQKYSQLNQDIFTINTTPQPILEIDDIGAYNQERAWPLVMRR